ncbi:unnamed protein product [Arabidopsis lyrata]|uniref:Predicted protein n=1 Tax=Arabidopsis lyrata subsp. lyrata TaxID=81972 RepID=D7KJ03_ARALL|nr:F-box protein At1g20360 [Arabidopsis lyrata subsp. lyrata]EFH69361.1 predicted protein [Arabidopsis lyrata subsp. lyrata]CAH8252952.1 unnamed protein product [Arabidopsis lyrata]|eukprot:XP_002893102.1 F-box protein At1g20360 [Arabidopsis lyrata subsp. lyrata]
MNDLPFHLLDQILFRLDPKSLGIMRCTNRSINSHISDDPNFVTGYSSEYSSRVGSSFIHLGCYGDFYIFCHHLASSCDSMSVDKRAMLTYHLCYFFGSCSGLLLLYMDGLFVANPLTKRFRRLNHSGSKLLSHVFGATVPFYDALQENKARIERKICLGFVVSPTKGFKIVCILEMETVYGFEISDGDSWRLSETTITTSSKSELATWIKPVYLDGTLHWLRNDGGIIAFNPETEQASFVPSIFHRGEPDTKLLFAEDSKKNCLILVSGTKETISVYTLVKNSKWDLTRQIANVYMNEGELLHWHLVMCDGKCLVVREMKNITCYGVVHVYDLEANTWGVSGSTQAYGSRTIDFYKFTPSLVFVEGDEQEIIASTSKLIISNLTAVMGLIDRT